MPQTQRRGKAYKDKEERVIGFEPTAFSLGS